MAETLTFLEQHGVLVLFIVTLLDQVGLPLPSGPMVVAAGALVGLGRLDPTAVVLAALLPTLLADWLWYELGRRKGTRVLRFLCRLSIEPDSCVRSTENLFSRQGPRTLLVARFVPGLSTVAPPLAGIVGMPPGRFLLFDTVGTLSWILSFGALGILFGHRLDLVGEWLSRMGTGGFLFLGGALALYLGFKARRRRQFLLSLRVDRVTPEELHDRIQAGDPVQVVDVRHRVEVDSDPRTIPGALVLPAEELEARISELDLERELVVYCT